MRIEPATIEDLSLLAELLMELFGRNRIFARTTTTRCVVFG
jgi:hypothetical protein